MLHGRPDWETEAISEEDDYEVRDLPDTITDLHSEDIIVKQESIIANF
jgi:hypothetical protein